MNIQCPHCHKAFKVDETDYAAIQQQVRNAEFQNEVERRLHEILLQHQAEEKARALEAQQSSEKHLAEKERENASLLNEIEQLKAKINAFDSEKKADLASLIAANVEKISEIKAEKEKEINDLKGTINTLRSQHEVDLINARNECKDDIHAKEKEITELSSQLEAQKVTAENALLEMNDRHKAILKAKEEEIERYKDLKSKLSTKMLGETLEQHCLNMFNLARSHGQFLNAYFEKDNDTSIGGTKGDFIFRDFFNGSEYISIMFEMKNEDDRTATKHKNEDFFAKLDKDRRDKGCEYAILVSTLEADNDFYNEGIVDVSYRHDKMLVIRPQFFMSVISLLSRTALRGSQRLIALQQEVEVAKAQSIDVTKFEERRDKFVSEFGKLVGAHIKKQDDALAGIDKAIEAAEKQAENLRKIKSLFEASRQKLISANEKAENDFTIRKLTHGNPTMRAKFDEARRNRDGENNNLYIN